MAKIITRNQLPYNLVDGIGVCYFDPETEKLKEFHSGLSLVVGPFETTVRRFYVVKPSTLINGFTPMYSIVSFRSILSDITFKVNTGADFAARDIKITTYTQDGAGAEVKNASQTIHIDKSYKLLDFSI